MEQTRRSKCPKYWLLNLTDAFKRSHHWSVAWSVKLYWLLTTFQSDAVSSHRCPSQVSNKYALALWLSVVFHGAKVNGSYCDVLLLLNCSHQSRCRRHYAPRRTVRVRETIELRLLKVPCFITPDLWPSSHVPTLPTSMLNPVDYRTGESCRNTFIRNWGTMSCGCEQIDRCCVLQGRIETAARKAGNSVTVLLRIYQDVCLPTITK